MREKLRENERQHLISEFRSLLREGPLCQRDMMRLLFLENGEDERAVVNAYVAAEGVWRGRAGERHERHQG